MHQIEEPKTNSKIIYQYTTHIQGILGSNKLWLTKLSGQNDPRERETLWFNPPHTYAMNSQLYGDKHREVKASRRKEIINGIENLSKEIKDPCRQASFSMDVYEENGAVNYQGDQHARMWAMYAGNHSGVCLAFSWEKIIENFKSALDKEGDLYAASIDYNIRQNPLDLPIAPRVSSDAVAEREFLPMMCQEILTNHWKETLFVKHWDWKDESEYRIIFRSHDVHEKRDHVEIPLENALVGIILGYYYDESNGLGIDFVNNYCTNHNITWKKIRWINGTPYYERRSDMEQKLGMSLNGYDPDWP